MIAGLFNKLETRVDSKLNVMYDGIMRNNYMGNNKSMNKRNDKRFDLN